MSETTATPNDAAPELQAGRVGRAHGLDGSFYVTGARPRLLELETNVTIAGRTAAIARRAGTDARPIVRVEGIDDRLGAEALRGAALMVRSLEAPALAAGEWWAHELEGCAVFDGDRALGIVSRLLELPSCEALEVQRRPAGHASSAHPADASDPASRIGDRDEGRPAGGEPLLVPMVKDAIRHIDTAARRIDVNMRFIED